MEQASPPAQTQHRAFAITNPEFLPPSVPPSAAPVPENAANKPIPTMMITGQMDVSDLAKGFGSEVPAGWAEYMLGVNGFGRSLCARYGDRSRNGRLHAIRPYTGGAEILKGQTYPSSSGHSVCRVLTTATPQTFPSCGTLLSISALLRIPTARLPGITVNRHLRRMTQSSSA